MAEARRVLDVSERGRVEGRVVPQVEEIGAELKVLPFSDVECLGQREIPVLLERPAVDVAPQSAVAFYTVGGERDCRDGREGVNVDVIVKPIFNSATGQRAANGCAWRQVCCGGIGAAQRVGAATGRVNNAERHARLEGRNPAQSPMTEQSAGES